MRIAMGVRNSTLVAAACVTLLWAGPVLAAPTAQQKCDGARVKAWRTYFSCVENVVAEKLGGVTVESFTSFAKCRHTYFSKWARLQGAAYAGSTCIRSRFTDNGDSTMTDNLSGLTWEKKTNLYFSSNFADPHDADNYYTWSKNASFLGNGQAFTMFLNTVNGGGGYGGSNDWRLPTLAELQTIVLDFKCTAASCSCGSNPCIDPALGPTNTLNSYGGFWSGTTYATSPTGAAWVVEFLGGNIIINGKPAPYAVRAVRGGL